jgi:hypothetical protein
MRVLSRTGSRRLPDVKPPCSTCPQLFRVGGFFLLRGSREGPEMGLGQRRGNTSGLVSGAKRVSGFSALQTCRAAVHGTSGPDRHGCPGSQVFVTHWPTSGHLDHLPLPTSYRPNPCAAWPPALKRLRGPAPPPRAPAPPAGRAAPAGRRLPSPGCSVQTGGPLTHTSYTAARDVTIKASVRLGRKHTPSRPTTDTHSRHRGCVSTRRYAHSA